MTDGEAPAPAAPTGSRAAALAALVLGACAIGFAPIFVRMTETGPAAAGFWRLFLALPLLALLMMRDGKGVATPPGRMMLLAGVLFALDLSFWHYGVKLTSVANATVLTNLSPVVVTVAAWFLFRERPAKIFVAGLALALAGAATMAMAADHGQAINAPLGDALSLATAVWYALYFIAMRSARQGAGASRAMFWSTLVSAPILLAVAFAFGERIIPGSGAGWAACVGLAVVHVAGQGSIAWALGRLPASIASVVVLAQPVVAAVAGWILFSEALTPLQIAGGVLTLAGVVIAQRAKVQKAD
ncbi:MAG: DMT family transporter [Caulobacter sp.]|nr:DMT family transporter [Caulobacter sp.]